MYNARHPFTKNKERMKKFLKKLEIRDMFIKTIR